MRLLSLVGDCWWVKGASVGEFVKRIGEMEARMVGVGVEERKRIQGDLYTIKAARELLVDIPRIKARQRGEWDWMGNFE